jgi:hypothetical protein
MADGGEMYPDLMSSTGLREDLKKSTAIKFLNLPPTSDCTPTPFSPGGHPFPLTGVPPNGRINQAFVLVELSIDNSQIDLINGSVFKLFCQMVESFVIFGDNHHPRRILVQPMDNAGSQDTVNPGEVFAMIKKSIDQCSGRVSIGRMNDHSWSFINNDDGGVFIKDGKRKGLWFE